MPAQEEMPAAPRLAPTKLSDLTESWGRKLLQEKHGFFCLSHAGTRLVLWFASLSGKGFCIPLQQIGGRKFLFMRQDLKDAFVPVTSLVRKVFVGDTVDLIVDKLFLYLGVIDSVQRENLCVCLLHVLAPCCCFAAVAAAGAAAKGVRCACDRPRGLVCRCVCLLHVLAPCCCAAGGRCCGCCC